MTVTVLSAGMYSVCPSVAVADPPLHVTEAAVADMVPSSVWLDSTDTFSFEAVYTSVTCLDAVSGVNVMLCGPAWQSTAGAETVTSVPIGTFTVCPLPAVNNFPP